MKIDVRAVTVRNLSREATILVDKKKKGGPEGRPSFASCVCDYFAKTSSTFTIRICSGLMFSL